MIKDLFFHGRGTQCVWVCGSRNSWLQDRVEEHSGRRRLRARVQRQKAPDKAARGLEGLVLYETWSMAATD